MEEMQAFGYHDWYVDFAETYHAPDTAAADAAAAPGDAAGHAGVRLLAAARQRLESFGFETGDGIHSPDDVETVQSSAAVAPSPRESTRCKAANTVDASLPYWML